MQIAFLGQWNRNLKKINSYIVETTQATFFIYAGQSNYFMGSMTKLKVLYCKAIGNFLNPFPVKHFIMA